MPTNRTLWIAGGVLGAVIAVLAAIVLAHRPDPDSKPYLKVQGGGFVFNYRVGEVFYGFSARIMRPIDVGTVLEAEFEDPAGGEPIVLRQRIGAKAPTLTMRTPGVTGVEKGRKYKVAIRLRHRDTNAVIAQYDRTYAAKIGMEKMPDGPLTVGPGYHRPQGQREPDGPDAD